MSRLPGREYGGRWYSRTRGIYHSKKDAEEGANIFKEMGSDAKIERSREKFRGKYQYRVYIYTPKEPTTPKPKKKGMSRDEGRGDTVVLGDHSIVQVGAIVMTKQGAGELRGIDKTTYSIPFCSVQLTEGAHKYEHIYTSASELTAKLTKTEE